MIYQNLWFDLFKLVPYSYYSERNGDDSPKDVNEFSFLRSPECTAC